jgi:DAK2 domain
MASAEDSMTRSREKLPALDAVRKHRLIVAIAGRIIAHVDELTALDAAIGDGDHGHNMRRGFEAVLQDLDALEAMGLSDLLKAIGTKLVMKVGGASGPLYGTLFLALGGGRGLRRGDRGGSGARQERAGPEDHARRPHSNLSGVFRGRRSCRSQEGGGRRGRSDYADARDPRSRFILGRAIDRPYGSRRAVVFADDRGALR